MFTDPFFCVSYPDWAACYGPPDCLGPRLLCLGGCNFRRCFRTYALIWIYLLPGVFAIPTLDSCEIGDVHSAVELGFSGVEKMCLESAMVMVESD